MIDIKEALLRAGHKIVNLHKKPTSELIKAAANGSENDIYEFNRRLQYIDHIFEINKGMKELMVKFEGYPAAMSNTELLVVSYYLSASVNTYENINRVEAWIDPHFQKITKLLEQRTQVEHPDFRLLNALATIYMRFNMEQETLIRYRPTNDGKDPEKLNEIVSFNFGKRIDQCFTKAYHAGFAESGESSKKLHQQWLKAAQQGNAQAIMKLAEKKFPNISPEEQIELLLLAADKGIAGALKHLGALFITHNQPSLAAIAYGFLALSGQPDSLSRGTEHFLDNKHASEAIYHMYYLVGDKLEVPIWSKANLRAHFYDSALVNLAQDQWTTLDDLLLVEPFDTILALITEPIPGSLLPYNFVGSEFGPHREYKLSQGEVQKITEMLRQRKEWVTLTFAESIHKDSSISIDAALLISSYTTSMDNLTIDRVRSFKEAQTHDPFAKLVTLISGKYINTLNDIYLAYNREDPRREWVNTLKKELETSLRLLYTNYSLKERIDALEGIEDAFNSIQNKLQQFNPPPQRGVGMGVGVPAPASSSSSSGSLFQNKIPKTLATLFEGFKKELLPMLKEIEKQIVDNQSSQAAASAARPGDG
ncbi:MAG: hypothetical protein P4L65_04375 [Legionella sp.]|nr:hypothetical protein [Legionella sp.]